MSESRPEAIPVPWSHLPQQWGHPWHSMCSYLGAFPPSMARSLIALLSDEGDTVLDPFSGRGTTLLEARLLNRSVIASDLNPIAYALSTAKATDVDPDAVKDRIRELAAEFDPVLYRPEARAQTDRIKLIYHNETLAELCFLRRKLVGSDWQTDRFLTGLLLGVMHGSSRKDGSSAYASISMPNTFSMSPNYVRKYVRENDLRRTHRNVFSLLTERVEWLCRGGTYFPGSAEVTMSDARAIASDENFGDFRGEVDFVLTSPPYLSVVHYAKQNWIRAWLFEQEYDCETLSLDDNLDLNSWLSLLKECLAAMKELLAPGGVIGFVVADVTKGANSTIPLSREVLRRARRSDEFGFIGCLSDYYETGDKTTRIWRDTKGKASRVERVILLANEPPELRVDSLNQAIPGVGPPVLSELDTKALEAHAQYLAAG